jgi:hypothetical protein
MSLSTAATNFDAPGRKPPRAARVTPKVGALHGVHDPESGGGGTKRFRPVPSLGALAHHLEKVA